MKSIQQRSSQLLLVLSGIAIVLFVVLRAGIGATPYETADNAGRPMGFNDPLGLDHYGIIIRNFSPSLLIRPEYFYEWILFAAYTIGCTFFADKIWNTQHALVFCYSGPDISVRLAGIGCAPDYFEGHVHGTNGPGRLY